MPRTKSPERENERRDQLIQASYPVFAERGFDQVRLEDIAAAAGFSKAVVHYYFDKKDEFLVGVFQWITGTILERLNACTQDKTGAQARLRAQLEELFVSPRRNRRFYHVYLDFLTQSVHNPRLGRITAAFYEGCRQAMAGTIAAGCAEGIFRPDLDPLGAASVCGAMMDGLQMQWLFDQEDRFEAYRERCWQSWLAYLCIQSASGDRCAPREVGT
jgi:TetR/AcrR family fatty acid metabolism transcriptional regulator